MSENKKDNKKDDEINKLFNACCEYYNYVEEMSEYYNISEEEVEEIFTTILSDGMKLMYQGIQEIVEGIEFYKMIFEKIKTIETYQDLINVVKFQFVDNANSPHQKPIHNIVIFCLKMTTHLVWQKCYDLAPRLHPIPKGALEDILYPDKASQREMKKIIEFLEEKYNIKIFDKIDS